MVMGVVAALLVVVVVLLLLLVVVVVVVVVGAVAAVRFSLFWDMTSRHWISSFKHFEKMQRSHGCENQNTAGSDSCVCSSSSNISSSHGIVGEAAKERKNGSILKITIEKRIRKHCTVLCALRYSKCLGYNVMREKHRLTVFENRVLRKIFGPNRLLEENA
jgi:hypothetical protein